MGQNRIPILIVCGLTVAALIYSRSEPQLARPGSNPAVTVLAPASAEPLTPIVNAIDASTQDEIRRLSTETSTLLQQGETRVARARLMAMAADAVAAGDKELLAHIMLLLGGISTQDLDLDSAEVFLLEALDIYANDDDPIGTARVHMQLGRMHLKSRQMARTAGQAYDRLLVARWEVDHKYYLRAEDNLRQVIESNLSINRFGAAASAYASLVTLYTRTNDSYRAETAAVEAARLFAASGQLRRARAVLTDLEQARIEPSRLARIEQEIDDNYRQFETGVAQIERAKDYQRLYHHYKASGEEQRAWKLRVLSSESLARAPKRAMYQRQPDVLAVLYNSNESMENARDYLQRAQRAFEAQGLDELSTQSTRLATQVY